MLCIRFSAKRLRTRHLVALVMPCHEPLRRQVIILQRVYFCSEIPTIRDVHFLLKFSLIHIASCALNFVCHLMIPRYSLVPQDNTPPQRRTTYKAHYENVTYSQRLSQTLARLKNMTDTRQITRRAAAGATSAAKVCNVAISGWRQIIYVREKSSILFY